MSRDKKLSSADIALFRDTVGAVRPVPNDRIHSRRRRRPQARSREKDEALVLKELLSDEYDPSTWETGDELLFARPGLQHTVLRRLRRGHFTVGAELDLHGLTVSAARNELTRFLHRCARSGIRCIRIVHGKGYGSRGRQPVLKHKVNGWLRQWDEVLAFCSARKVDGGTGAVYVLIKVRR